MANRQNRETMQVSAPGAIRSAHNYESTWAYGIPPTPHLVNILNSGCLKAREHVLHLG